MKTQEMKTPQWKNDNINNKHNIDNSKNYQTTTTKFLFNPILLFDTVSYDFIVAPVWLFYLFLSSYAKMQFKSSSSIFSYIFFF